MPLNTPPPPSSPRSGLPERTEKGATNTTPGMALKTPLVAVLEASKPVAFNINFARITGDAKAALLLSQLVYWTRKGPDVLDNNGWVFKSREQFEAELGLGRHEQTTARGVLISLGLIEEARMGAPARNCYRVNPQVLGAYLAQLVRAEPVQWSLLDMRSETQDIRGLLGRQFAFYRVLINVTGSCTSAIYLSKALAIQRRFMSKEGQSDKQTEQLSWDTDWFRMANDSTQADTGLTSAQQRNSKQKLCLNGILQEAMMTHPRKQLYIKLNLNRLDELLREGAIVEGVANSDKAGKCMGSMHFPKVDSPATPLADSSPIEADFNENPSSAIESSPTKEVPGCQNQQSRMPDSGKLDGRFSHASWPVLARGTAGFSTPSWPVLAPLHAHASRAGQDYKRDHIKITTTTQLTSIDDQTARLEQKPPPNPDFEGSGENTVPSGLSVDVVVVSSETEVKTSFDPAWIWPDSLSAAEREQGARILLPLAKTGNLEEVQAILDELSGCIAAGQVKSHLAYLRRLVQVHTTTPGGLVFERALDVRQRRERLQALTLRAAEQTQHAAGRGAEGRGAERAGNRQETGNAPEQSSSVELSEVALSGLAKARAMLAEFKKGRADHERVQSTSNFGNQGRFDAKVCLQ